ncbi:condensin-2 complex subunit H2 [Periplaneta americana]|uniref:condensin-2 complex subunit H2 n=1 Tax=Periplaneta americana TaxID=6978 RepID=UPI0037E88C40
MTNDNVSSKILSKIEELMKPLGKLSKTWHEHLSKYLDEYMQCIEELAADGELGLAALNFVQAGMMIENTTKMYSINVDYLWQFMVEVLEILRMNRKSGTSKKNIEDPENANEQEKVPRRRVRKRVVCEDFSEVEPNVIDPDMKADDGNEPIKPLPIRQHVMTKTDWKRRKRNYHIFDVEGDTLDPADYSVMFQTSGVGKLQLNMLKEIINENNEHRSQESVTELIHVLGALLKELSRNTVDVNLSESASDEDTRSPYRTEDEEPQTLAPMLVTPPPSPMSIKRSSSSDNDTLLSVKRSLSDTDADADMELDRECRVGHSVREKEMIVNVNDTWETARIDETMRDRPLRKGTNLPCDISLLRNERKRKSKWKKQEETEEEVKKLLWDYCGMDMNYSMKDDYFPLFYDFQVLYLRQKNKKEMKLTEDLILYNYYKDTRNLHLLLSRECEKDFLGFEDYEPEPGEEEGFRGFELEEDDEDILIENDDRGEPEVSSSREDEHSEEPQDILCSTDVDNTSLENMFNTDNVHETTHDNVVADIAKRVAEWERFIRPRLKVAHDRGYFDIHGIGTEILNSFPKTSSKATLKFDQVVEDVPREDISRYFLAALQLANTYNIEISNTKPGILAMDCMEMTLLTPVRHHEALEEYEPPSEGMKRKKYMRQARTESSDSESDSDSDGEDEDHPETSTRKCKRNKR